MTTEPELVKIGELARRAGVNRGTIQHYLRQGLLPKPVKTHRNMAYYEASSVERIRLIKDLQRRRFLPLQVIRKIVSGRNPGAQVKAVLDSQQAALTTLAIEPKAGALALEEAARAFELPKKLMREMERQGLVGSYEKDGQRVFSGPDLEVLAAVGQLKQLGFTEAAGFEPKDLLMYKKSAEALLEQEVGVFLQRVVGSKSPEEATRLARAGVNGGTALLVAVRKKLIIDMLASAGPEAVDQLLSGAPQR
ncbi:MAG: MerR family transcriptional regulator [Myxococcales bacterium]|nr:MerR family transcriptional regulator [Myxococcales bacterium]